MKYQITFLIIVFAAAFLGILFALLNNDMAKDKQNDTKEDKLKVKMLLYMNSDNTKPTKKESYKTEKYTVNIK